MLQRTEAGWRGDYKMNLNIVTVSILLGTWQWAKEKKQELDVVSLLKSGVFVALLSQSMKHLHKPLWILYWWRWESKQTLLTEPSPLGRENDSTCWQSSVLGSQLGWELSWEKSAWKCIVSLSAACSTNAAVTQYCFVSMRTYRSWLFALETVHHYVTVTL